MRSDRDISLNVRPKPLENKAKIRHLPDGFEDWPDDERKAEEPTA
jgi:hypothetical protein